MKRKNDRYRIPIALIVLFWFFAGGSTSAASSGKKIVPLPEIIKPRLFLSDESQFYIVEQAAVYIYQWNGFRFLKKVGAIGEGPQEYNISRTGHIQCTVHPDKIIVYTLTKCLEYQKNGTFIKEYKIRTAKMTGLMGNIYRFGDFYLLVDVAPGEKLFENVSYYLCDLHLNKIRELFQKRLDVDPYKRKLYFFMQGVAPVFYKQMAFFAVGENLNIIGINSAGKNFLNLKYNYERIKLTQDHIAAFHSYFKTEHPDHEHYERLKSWFCFPGYFPAIKNIKVADDQIFVQTYRLNNTKETEFLIFDLKGNYLRTIYLPIVPENIETDYPFLIQNGQLIQLIENLDEENWAMFISTIH